MYGSAGYFGCVLSIRGEWELVLWQDEIRVYEAMCGCVEGGSVSQITLAGGMACMGMSGGMACMGMRGILNVWRQVTSERDSTAGVIGSDGVIFMGVRGIMSLC